MSDERTSQPTCHIGNKMWTNRRKRKMSGNTNERGNPRYCFIGFILKVPVSGMDEANLILDEMPDDVQLVYRLASMNYLKLNEVRPGELI